MTDIRTKQTKQIWRTVSVGDHRMCGDFDTRLEADAFKDFWPKNISDTIVTMPEFVGLDYVLSKPKSYRVESHLPNALKVPVTMVKPSPEAVKDFPPANIVGINPHTKRGNAQEWTVRQALMAALAECDEWSRVVIIVGDVTEDATRVVSCKAFMKAENNFEVLGLVQRGLQYIGDGNDD